jgi:predicted O-methyltransferase YrrM
MKICHPGILITVENGGCLMAQMIPDLQTYFGEFIPRRDELLLAMEKEAEREGIPIVGPVVGELLYILARLSRASTILELGTATGYSAIYLARGCELVGGRVITLEKDESMLEKARANLVKAGLDNRVEVLLGDVFELMAGMENQFDLIFMDIDKEAYTHALPHCGRLLKTGGLLVTDNIGFAAADQFNRTLFALEQWRTVHLLSFLPRHSPENDGLSLALKVG